MTTAADIQKQLEEAWENAESAQPQAGDAYIRRAVRDEISYEVGVAVRPVFAHDYRILERAKPKRPEWEAVVASYIHDEEHLREAFVRTASGGWESPTYFLRADELVDPVPLVELPERSDLHELFRRQCLDGWPGAGVLADAVLELLRGER